jgi:methylated-DNA-[protein]-cysteine S-methyltransferase
MPFTIFESPFGELTLVAGPGGVLRGLYFPGTAPALSAADPDPGALAAATEQLEQYFRGERTRFDLMLDYGGTPFQRSVWDAPRAVGSAVGATPIPIVIPCHRVIGSDGSLTGYGGGLPRKRALLDLEAGVLPLAVA